MNDERPHHHVEQGKRIGLVTGASSGIGRAIAIALAHAGVALYAVGRNPERLAETVEAARQFGPVGSFELDLARSGSIESLTNYMKSVAGRLDMLIHCAGVIQQGLLEKARIEDLDRQYVINVRVPYILTQHLAPLLIKALGQIVFINSSAGLSVGRANVTQYSATKHALRAIADGVRTELNPKGVRVLSVHLGRTATPMQQALFKQEGRDYYPEKLIQPQDVATIVLAALALPPTAEVTDISVRPMAAG